MRPKARIDCQIGEIFYEKGDEIDITNKDVLIRLNEQGFIEPLTPKQIQEFGKPRISKKEE